MSEDKFNVKDSAVLAALSIFNMSDDKSVDMLKIANSLLSKNKNNKLFTEEELNKHLEFFANKNISILKGFKLVKKNLRRSNWTLSKYVKKLNGKSLFLEFPFDGKIQETVEFNCDGKGSFKRSNGTILKVSFTSLINLIKSENNLGSNFTPTTGWIVSKEKHPEIGNRKMQIRDYADEFLV